MLAMISQPMAGKKAQEMEEVRRNAFKALKNRGYEVTLTLFENERTIKSEIESMGIENVPLYYLGRSLEKMSMCNAVYFCKGWENARGCRIEHEAAKAYGLEIIYEE